MELAGLVVLRVIELSYPAALYDLDGVSQYLRSLFAGFLFYLAGLESEVAVLHLFLGGVSRPAQTNRFFEIFPVVRDEVLAEYPDIADILNAISATLDTETVTALNARVDLDKEDYADIAADYFAGLS